MNRDILQTIIAITFLVGVMAGTFLSLVILKLVVHLAGGLL